jgi:hypothetical protein
LYVLQKEKKSDMPLIDFLLIVLFRKKVTIQARIWNHLILKENWRLSMHIGVASFGKKFADIIFQTTITIKSVVWR